jgi:hypothetical protein
MGSMRLVLPRASQISRLEWITYAGSYVTSSSWTTALNKVHFVTALSHAYVVKQRMRALPWRVGASPTLQAVRATKHLTLECERMRIAIREQSGV